MTFSFEEAKRLWNESSVIPPKFPLVFMEDPKARELRIFEDINHLVGDIDFSGYKASPYAFIVDDEGNKYHLKFKKTLLPVFTQERVSGSELYQQILPALMEANDFDRIEILKEKNVHEIIKSLSEKYTW